MLDGVLRTARTSVHGLHTCFVSIAIAALPQKAEQAPLLFSLGMGIMREVWSALKFKVSFQRVRTRKQVCRADLFRRRQQLQPDFTPAKFIVYVSGILSTSRDMTAISLKRLINYVTST